MWTPYNQIFVWRVLFSYFVQQSKCCLFQTIYFWIFCREYESMSWCYCSNFTCPKWKKMRFYFFWRNEFGFLFAKHAHSNLFFNISIISRSHIGESNNKKYTQLIHTHIHTEAHQSYIDRIKCISASFFSYIVLPNSCWFGLMRCSIHTHMHPCNPYDDNGVCFTLVWYAMKNQLQSEEKNIVHIIDDITSIACDCSRCVFIRVLCIQSRTHTRSLSNYVLLSECWCSCCCW